MSDPHTRGVARVRRALLVLAGAAALLVGYAVASEQLWAGSDIVRHQSGILDFDTQRVLTDWGTRRPAYRTSIHPLYKILVAPAVLAFREPNARWSLDSGVEKVIASVRIVTALGMTLTVLMAGWLAAQLARRFEAGAWAAALCAVSFSSLLLATLPESASISGITTFAPLLYLNRRLDRAFGWGEAVAWGLLGVICVSITVTQIMHWAIALGVRVWFLGSPAATARRLVPKLALAAAVAAAITFAGVELQRLAFPGTFRALEESPLRMESQFVRLEEIRYRPVRHAARLAAHFLVYDFAAPLPTLSPYLMRDEGRDYWTISIEETGPAHWHPLQIALGAAILAAVLAAALALRGSDRRFVGPALVLTAQLALHFVYGREWVIYSSNWHGVLVAVLVAAAWRAWPGRFRALRGTALALAAALLLNNLVVLDRIRAEFDAGLDRSLRDTKGQLLRAAPQGRRVLQDSP